MQTPSKIETYCGIEITAFREVGSWSTYFASPETGHPIHGLSVIHGHASDDEAIEAGKRAIDAHLGAPETAVSAA